MCYFFSHFVTPHHVLIRQQSNDLLEHLPTAAFVAIDEEMTGISLPGTKRPTKDDTPSQRYKTLKAVPERYGIIQFGVALFHEHPDHLKEESGGSEFLVVSEFYSTWCCSGCLSSL